MLPSIKKRTTKSKEGSYIANDTSGTVWRIDTLPFSYAFPVKIVTAQWTEAVSSGDQIVLQNTASKPIIDSQASSPNFQQNFGFLGWQNGIKVTTLTSGVLQLSVGGGK
jgi:hypothetical protein